MLYGHERPSLAMGVKDGWTSWTGAQGNTDYSRPVSLSEAWECARGCVDTAMGLMRAFPSRQTTGEATDQELIC